MATERPAPIASNPAISRSACFLPRGLKSQFRKQRAPFHAGRPRGQIHDQRGARRPCVDAGGHSRRHRSGKLFRQLLGLGLRLALPPQEGKIRVRHPGGRNRRPNQQRRRFSAASVARGQRGRSFAHRAWRKRRVRARLRQEGKRRENARRDVAPKALHHWVDVERRGPGIGIQPGGEQILQRLRLPNWRRASSDCRPSKNRDDRNLLDATSRLRAAAFAGGVG